MSKVAHYLQEHLLGEVMTGIDARRYFSTDASILMQPPALVVYPRNENDIRKTARFTWQLAERGRVIPITARGSGTDQTGAALGRGIVMAFPAHLHRILELDTKTHTVAVEPGINFGKLQQALLTHHRFLPFYPASIEYSTVGGAVANNASGEKSVKYGETRDFVQKLRVVLANGEVIETGRLTKRELSKKLGLATFEGEIYRSLDTLLEENRELADTLARNARNNAGYHLADIIHRDGSFDLTPLFVGSQGTLGIISEIVLETEAHNPATTLLLATFDSIEQTQNAVLELRQLSEMPSAIELVDGELLKTVHELNPNLLKEVLSTPFPNNVLLVEFDSTNERTLKKNLKKAGKIFERHATSLHTETELEAQQQLWKIRQASGMLISHNEGLVRSLPILEGVSVPVDQLRSFAEGATELLKKAGVTPAMWGSVGDGVFNVQPKLNIGQVGDRQKALKLMEEYYRLVISLGGSVSGQRNDGRLRAPYVEAMYGPEAIALFQKVKIIFDPYGTMNPGVKLGTTIDDLKVLLRQDYGLDHLYDHLPRS